MKDAAEIKRMLADAYNRRAEEIEEQARMLRDRSRVLLRRAIMIEQECSGLKGQVGYSAKNS